MQIRRIICTAFIQGGEAFTGFGKRLILLSYTVHAARVNKLKAVTKMYPSSLVAMMVDHLIETWVTFLTVRYVPCKKHILSKCPHYDALVCPQIPFVRVAPNRLFADNNNNK